MSIDNKHFPIVKPPLSLKELSIIYSATLTYYINVIRLLLIQQQQKGRTPRITRGTASSETNEISFKNQ